MSRTVQQPWPIEWACDVAEVDPTVLASSHASAQIWLWALSGRRVGVFQTIEDAYISSSSCEACGVPYKGSDGEWRNGGNSSSDCCAIELMNQPVVSISEVRLYGEVLDPSEYEIQRNSLVRLGGCWPCDSSACEPAAIEVDYVWGVPLDALGKLAVGELACEFVLGMTGENCRLPSRAVSVSRQGVSIEMQDAQGFAEQGLTGLPLSDSWLRSMNPHKLQQRSRVVSVDQASRV